MFKPGIAALALDGGFARDPRFEPTGPAVFSPLSARRVATEDPAVSAWAEGYRAGFAEANADAERDSGDEATAREALGLSFARLDTGMQGELRLRLRETVAVLCGAAIAPLALDEAALLRRIEAAVAMFARADDERLIRLNPADLALISDRLRADWQVEADATLERGALRVESTLGGVEDGPAQWRRAIAEAIERC